MWTVVILLASSDLFSSSHTGSLLNNLVTAIVGHPLPDESFATVHYVLRKGGHLLAYGLLGALWFRAIRAERPGLKWTWSAAAVALAMAVALIDEWHQTYVPSRTGTPVDVLIDTIAAALGTLRPPARTPSR
jgi:VanZ family protein